MSKSIRLLSTVTDGWTHAVNTAETETGKYVFGDGKKKS